MSGINDRTRFVPTTANRLLTILAIAITWVFVPGAYAATGFTINAGLNDAWYYPGTDGQGFFITVFPDLGKVTLGWFTYDTELPSDDAVANLGDPGHRWLTAIGPIDGDQSVMRIVLTSGGIFDTATEISRTDPRGSDGYIILTFDSCNSGTVEYDITSIGRTGIVPIQRVAGDNIVLCEALSDDEGPDDADFVATDWTDETHSKGADPDFDEVFDDNAVKRLDIVITEERWQSMLDDMTETYGEFGAFSPGGLVDTNEDPIFVPAEVFYNGIEWYRVGVRFKGNSSLQSSWQHGILKLPFKLDFDEFEDDYPQIDNQRFYGFKKFSLKNNFDDESMMREKVAADVFKNAGVPVSHTAFYALYLDHGNGPEYFGLYTLVEEVDNTVIDTQFTSDDGNLYKPEEGGANFVEGTFSTENFEKKTNEDDEDWSDIISLFSALHDDTRTTAPATWRANLEAVFNVDGFLRYLAVNGIIQNWDTYGRMPHNYYLYNNPDTEKLTWIPWDNNEALQTGKNGGALALDFSNLNASEWPLIANIYADDVYRATYNSYLADVMSYAFETSIMQSTYDGYAALLEPYATAELQGYSFLERYDDFYNAVATLKLHATSRASAVTTYLNSQ